MTYDPLDTGPTDNNADDVLESLTTEERTITNIVGAAALDTSQTISTGTITQVNLDTTDIEDATVVDVDLANNKLIAKKAGKYFVTGQVTYAGSADWTAGDLVRAQVVVGATGKDERTHHSGVNEAFSANISAIFDAAADTDIILRTDQNTGGDESILNNSQATFLHVVFLG